MVNLSPPLPMILDLNRGSGREVFCLALLASISDLFPGFFSRNWVPSFALVLVRAVCGLEQSVVHVEMQAHITLTAFPVDLLE